jgi:tetratricopeptide (TPR) repeat protein
MTCDRASAARRRAFAALCCLPLLGWSLIGGCHRPVEDAAVISDFGRDSVSFRAELEAARNAVMQGDLDRSDSLARLVHQGSMDPERSKQRMMALSIMGHVLQARRDLDSAANCFRASIAIAEEYGEQQHVAIGLLNLGTVLQEQGDYEGALEQQLRGRDLRRALGDSSGLAKSWNNIGILLTRKNDTLAAAEAFRTAIAINERRGDSSSWSKSLANRAVVEMDQAHYDTALFLLERAVAVRPSSSFGRSISFITINRALAYEGLGRSAEARALYVQAINEAGAEEDPTTQGAGHHYLADLLVREGDHHAARAHLDSSITLAQRTGSREDLKEAHLSSSKSYAATGEYERAYQHYVAYNTLADSLMNAEKDRTMSELLVRNDVQRKERENADLRSAQALAQIEARGMRWLTVALCLLAVAIAVAAWLLLQRSRERAKRRETELEQQALRLQMDPHFLFNALNTIPGLYASTDARMATAYVGHLSNLLRLILETSRKLQVPLRQETELLEHYLHVSASRHPGLYTYAIHIDPAIDRDAVTIPPMLLQPLVENAILHGLVPRKGGGELEVDISRSNGVLVCRVRDNGVGRAASARTRSGALGTSRGLEITAERMRQHNRGRAAVDGLRIIDLHDENGRPRGTEVVVRTVIDEAWT